jgi:hypothetical protein
MCAGPHLKCLLCVCNLNQCQDILIEFIKILQYEIPPKSIQPFLPCYMGTVGKLW